MLAQYASGCRLGTRRVVSRPVAVTIRVVECRVRLVVEGMMHPRSPPPPPLWQGGRVAVTAGWQRGWWTGRGSTYPNSVTFTTLLAELEYPDHAMKSYCGLRLPTAPKSSPR